MKFVLALAMALGLSSITTQTAHAAEPTFTQSIVKRTSCDQRDPIIAVTLPQHAWAVRFGAPGGEADYVLDRDVDAGTHRYRLPRQAFGSTKQWVIVVRFDKDSFARGAIMTFERPARSACVVKRNPRITSYSSDVNVTCGADFEKMVIARLRVKRVSPGYIVAPGVVKLTRKNGTELHSTTENTSFVGGSGGDRRMVEYYFFVGRRVQFKINPDKNSVRSVVVSSKNVELVASLDAECMSMVP